MLVLPSKRLLQFEQASLGQERRRRRGRKKRKELLKSAIVSQSVSRRRSRFGSQAKNSIRAWLQPVVGMYNILLLHTYKVMVAPLVWCCCCCSMPLVGSYVTSRERSSSSSSFSLLDFGTHTQATHVYFYI